MLLSELMNPATASHGADGKIRGVWDNSLFGSSLLHHMKVVRVIVKAFLSQNCSLKAVMTQKLENKNRKMQLPVVWVLWAGLTY